MKASTMRAALATAFLLAVPESAGAAYVAGEAGNSQPFVTSPSPGVGGTIDFAVYDRTGGTAGDVFGTGIANFDALFSAGLGSRTLDTSASYLYLFQTINDGPASGAFPIDVQGIYNSAASPTSFGSFAGTSFSQTVLGTPAGFSNPSPVDTDGVPTIVAGETGLVAPGLSQKVSFLYILFIPGLKSGQSSELFGYTSDHPGFPQSITLTGGTSIGADGDVVQARAVPEPSSLALVMLGGAAAVGSNRARRRRGRSA